MYCKLIPISAFRNQYLRVHINESRQYKMRWTKESIKASAKGFSSYEEWKKANSAAHAAMRRMAIPASQREAFLCLDRKGSGCHWADTYTQTACVYVATSARSGKVKLGISDRPHDRVDTINSQYLDSCNDWHVVAWIDVKTLGAVAGEIEARTAQAFSSKSCGLVRYGSPSKQPCRECYADSSRKALYTAMVDYIARITAAIVQKPLTTVKTNLRTNKKYLAA